jgi:Ribbon-helix-helix protein, copG family
MTERLCHIPIIYGMGFRMKTTLNIDDSVMAELKREAARQGRTMSELVETALECGRVPSADEIRALRRARVSAAEAKKVGDARRASEARLRSGWDSYCGAIEAARGGNVARLVDCLRARKAVADGDRDRLAAFVATKVRRRRWPPELVRALGRGAPTEGDFDLLADLVEVIGRRAGGVRDQPVHRAARLAEVLLSLLGRRVPNAMRTAVIEYACEAEGDDAGVAIEPERVRDLLNRPKARRQY